MSAGFRLKNGSLMLSTEAPGGIYNSTQLKRIAALSDQDTAIVKVTEDQRLALFVQEDQAGEIAAQLEEIGLGIRPYRSGLHQPTACIGSMCPEHEQDALNAAMQASEALATLQVDSPLRIGINGCATCCVPCHTLDISVIGDEDGYRLSLGGKNSQIPEMATFMAEGVPEAELPTLLGKVIEVFSAVAEADETLQDVMDRVGIQPFVEALSPYSQDAAGGGDDPFGFGGGDDDNDEEAPEVATSGGEGDWGSDLDPSESMEPATEAAVDIDPSSLSDPGDLEDDLLLSSDAALGDGPEAVAIASDGDDDLGDDEIASDAALGGEGDDLSLEDEDGLELEDDDEELEMELDIELEDEDGDDEEGVAADQEIDDLEGGIESVENDELTEPLSAGAEDGTQDIEDDELGEPLGSGAEDDIEDIEDGELAAGGGDIEDIDGDDLGEPLAASADGDEIADIEDEDELVAVDDSGAEIADGYSEEMSEEAPELDLEPASGGHDDEGEEIEDIDFDEVEDLSDEELVAADWDGDDDEEDFAEETLIQPPTAAFAANPGGSGSAGPGWACQGIDVGPQGDIILTFASGAQIAVVASAIPPQGRQMRVGPLTLNITMRGGQLAVECDGIRFTLPRRAA